MTRAFCLTSALALIAGAAQADMNFNRIASFPVASNMAAGEDASRVTSAEIIDATEDGMTLVYTDSPLGVVGFVDITDPASPAPLGELALDGEPTSVAVIGGTAFVGVNTSESYTAPSGSLIAVDVATREILASCDLGGQPDSVAKAKDGSFLAIAIENERDEEVNDGEIPQMPGGYLAIVGFADGALDCSTLNKVDLTGLAEIAPEDPEPEFVDINGQGEIVVTLQENNHIAVVGRDGEVVSHFSAGAVNLEGIDIAEDDTLDFTGRLTGVPREPDAVKWLDDNHFATANEGDYKGGSRGWTIFAKDGSIVYENGAGLEHEAVKVGHYPESRSENKGIEPESVTTGTFNGAPLAFIGAERASIVGVYDVSDVANPVFRQILPSGIGPEGYVAIPERNLLISANETDLGEDGGARAHVMIYEYQDAPAAYPQLTSEGMDELTGWSAISGMAADEDGSLWAVNDSYFAGQPTIFHIDPSQTPARITAAIRVTRDGAPAEKMDMEGITLDGAGGFWIANEGDAEKEIPHAIYHVGADGAIIEEVGIPEDLAAQQTRFGFEGIAKIGDMLWMAVQREWGDDPKGLVKLLAYDTAANEWGAVRYELDAPTTGWVGLSEITVHGAHVYLVERDNLVSADAVTKKIYRVPVADLQAAPLGGDLPVVAKEEVRDLVPNLTATGGFVLDKVESLAIGADGKMWIATDNDGVDDSTGETMFFAVGNADS